MKAITVRNIPPEVQKLIRERSRKKRLSANRAVLDLLLDQAGAVTKRQPRLHHDLDELAGWWSEAESRSFDEAVALQRGIDEELWR
ncbi:MAG TPA: hypothetical protein VNM92_16720 [Thermoanaerobaculia bacterium]|nr:hypothetical protein [Thermoanaerobaculia bacterium]